MKLTKDEALALLVNECPELGTQVPGEVLLGSSSHMQRHRLLGAIASYLV